MQVNSSIQEKADKQWNAVFPPEQKTEDDCLLFISRMSYIAFAEYLLHREIVSPKVCKRRRIGDIVFHTFNKELRWGSKLSDMMRGIGEAVKMKYARQAFVMINEDDDDHDLATEVFTMSFAYNEDDCLKITDENGNSIVSMGYKGKEMLRKQVRYLIQKISAISSGLKKFNGSVTPFIKITYFDDRTPTEYQPFAFQHCDTTYIFKSVPPRFDFGVLSTNFGVSAIDIQSVYIEDAANLEEATLCGFDRREMDFLDVTIDGDITLNDPGYAEIEDINRLDTMEVARDDECDEHAMHDHHATYEITETDPILRDDLDSSCGEQSPDTTNEDDLVSVQTAQSGKKGLKKKVAKKPPIRKSPLKHTRAARGQKRDFQFDDEVIEEFVPILRSSKVSKAHTSPNRQFVSPDHRNLGRSFKSSVVMRRVVKSPDDLSDDDDEYVI